MFRDRIALSWRKKIFLRFGLLLIYLLTSAEGFVNAPKIITKDGNLIFESGLNRNISFTLNGNSRININDEFDLLDLIFLNNKKGRNSSAHSAIDSPEISDADLQQLSTDFAALRTHVFGTQGLDKLLRRLQNRTRNANQLLRRYQTRLQTVETKVQTLETRLEVDSCKSNPCENGGTCFNIFNGYICKCTKNFEGATCEKDVNECAVFAGTDLGCQNGGQCVNQFGGYSCLCSPGWFGIHCTQRKGDCMQSSAWELCGHGTCVSSNDNFGYKCICDQGWKTNGLTPSCMVDVDECSESHPPCSTKCINLPGSFTCGPCDVGLTGNGVNCRDIDECAMQNGGCSLSPRVPCINSYGSYHCGECPLGWQGDGRHCTRVSGNDNAFGASCSNNNICHPEAICSEISNTVVCTCPTGMFGSGIGANGCVAGTDKNCNSLPCQNGGTCIDSGSGYMCICPQGFREPNCTPIASPCASNPCHNGGRCQPQAGTQFQCVCEPGYTGRLCDSRFSRCGGMLVGTSGQLKYPEGSLYEHNAQCAWVIRTNESLVLNVTFNAFELEDASECRYDWLQINDGRTAAAQLVGRFCGSHKPMGGNIISTTNDLYLWFRSDNSTSKEGFDLTWNSMPPQCGGIIEVQEHGTIATPGTPGNYPKNRDCRWQLRAPNNKRIRLTFFSLQIEKHDSCNFDYVEITDSISDLLLEKFCNTSHPPPLLLPTNEATIHFHSDNEGGDTGFQIYYSTEERTPGCGGTFTAKEGIIKSPTFIDDAISCEYDIQMSQSESITIDFTMFDMGLDDCIEMYDVDFARHSTTLQSKNCGYGGSPVMLHSLYNAVKLKYYSKGGQFELKYRADCSYTFENYTDTILSPGYPNLDKSERFCTFKISTAPNTVISLNIVDFELKDSTMSEEENECAYSYLRINDGLDKNIMGPYCRNNTPPQELVSKTNLLILHFQTGLTTSGRGFKITYRAIPMGKTDCGGVYSKPGYSIRLPTGDDGMYMHDMECFWVIMAPVGKHIMLSWKSFKLEETTDCIYDYVEIYDNLANNENDRPLGRYCNAAPPATISHSRIVTIKFVSDFSDANEGFEASYEFVDTSNNCGGEILSSTGKISSPEWPKYYTNGLDCTWTITTPPGSQMELEIDTFELEDTENCSGDWLEIRNGGSPQSTLVGYFCGRTIPRTIPSFTNQMRLHFHSDTYLNAHGFQIRWKIFSNGCGGYLKSELGVIMSPAYPNPYPNNAQCEWQVQVHKGSTIHFTIEDMGMEDLMDCNYDYLEIFDGRSSADIPLTKICKFDNETQKQFVTSSNEALIRFRTDSSNNDRGFQLSYYANCTHTTESMFGAIESPNYGDLYYKNDVNCTWTIKAPRGNRIALEFTAFNNFHRTGQVYFMEQTKNGTQAHVIEDKRSFNSSTDTLLIVQNGTDVSFRLEYAVIGCIESFHRETGEFTSPNYPKAYPNDMECTWIIKTEVGKGIELTVDDMDIEQSVNCTKDALHISSYRLSRNPKERHCGKQPSLVVTSSSHILFIHFFSDGTSNGKGFKAHYRVIDSSCGGVFSSKNGIIQSPNYPLNYPPNSDCEWTIAVTDHHTITITLEELDMEDYYNDCEMDSLEVSEPAEGEEDKEHVILRKCGQLGGGQTQWKTISNIATVRFKTDDSIEAKGFKLGFEENCGQRVTVDNSDFQFIDIVRNGQTNETCEWMLKAKDATKHIVFTPSHVQLSPLMAMEYQTEGDCMDIGAKVYDGTSDQAPLRAKFCKTHPPDIISNGNALTVKVPLGVISEFSAFYMIMDNYCGASYQSITGKFASPYYPSSYPVNINCEWYIAASAGNSIVLTIESLSLEESDGCNNDYLEVREDNEQGRLLGLFCGANVPTPIVGANSLWVKFNSDDDNVGQGFLASYNYAMHNELNGTSGTIESPNFSTQFVTHEKYSWRITVDKEYVVLLTIKHIIDIAIPYVKFYDGYSDIGAELDYTNTHVVRSNTNILYLTAASGPFEFEWQQLSKEAVRSNRSAEHSFEACGKSTITVGSSLLFNSPGYPNGYDSNLRCSWVFLPENAATHIEFSFVKVDLEEFSECFTDNVVVSASADLEHWTELAKVCKKPLNAVKQYSGTPYLQVAFNTDASINKTGFSSYVKTACGAELTDRIGFVNVTKLATGLAVYQMDCVWTIRVRQSRRIRITFLDSYLQSSNDTGTNCRSYFVVRNGMAEDSPFLGKGKYCENNINDVLETTSNRAFIRFVRVGFTQFKASFHYEEIRHECSDEIVLSDETPMDSMKTISSPNYPNIPNPHSECIWKVEAPPHHVITINFMGHFDLAGGSAPIVSACDREYVQLNDGASELMPLIGRYCGATKPDSKQSSGNVLRIKYFTDISEPHAGFTANVSIGRCGGTYYTSEGTIHSPEKLTLRADERDFECIYTIEVERGNTIKLHLEQLELPTAENCSEVSHIELQEVDGYGESENITDILSVCGPDVGKRYIVETNKIIMRYRIKGQTSVAENVFKINYVAIGARCGETIKASMGILHTPGYPNGVNRPTHCVWYIQVPKGKRVKIEFIDFDTGAPPNASSAFGRMRTFRGRISFANDYQMQSVIARISENPPAQLYSTDNTMAIDAFLLSFNRHRGFKLRFTSYEASIACSNSFQLEAGGTVQFKRPNDSDIYCSYALKMRNNETLALHFDRYDKNFSNPVYSSFCSFLTPVKLVLNEQPLLPDLMCNNDTVRDIRLPFPVTLKLLGNRRNRLQQLDIHYKFYKCGGIWPIDNNLTVTQPIMRNHIGELECAWAIWQSESVDVENLGESDYWMEGVQLEISLTTDFKRKCEEQYLILYNGPNQNSPHLGRYCNQATAVNLVVEHGLFFEYYTSSYETNSTFNLSIQQGSGCGGKLTYPYREIWFYDQYKNNVECVWELETENGFHLGLYFFSRFFIETSPNCSKDYIKVQQKNLSDDWVDLQTICGRDPPAFINTTTTQMRLIFHSDGDTLGDGFAARFERNCGGTLYATNERQRLSSPGYPLQYQNNLFCNYTIVSQHASNKAVLVRFLDFEIEEPPMTRCMFDNVTVTVKDQYDNAEETVLCGTNKSPEFRGEAIAIVLRTDQSFGSKGFMLEYSNNVCGGLITNSTIIESPREHKDKMHPQNMDCYWNFTAQVGQKILIKFEELDFESHAQCSYDSVEVYRGLAPVADQRVLKICGNLTGAMPVLTIPTHTGLLRSYADSSEPSRGFKALVSFVPNCDKQIYLGLENGTYSFNTYANGYANDLDCSYIFTTLQGRQLQIDFGSFHLEESVNCQNDYVDIRDGAGLFADVIGQFCGHEMPTRLTSSRNSLFVRFVSDLDTTSSGFTATISSIPQICGQHNLRLTADEKIILKSPDDGNGKYPKNSNCFWRIIGEKNLHLKFDSFDIKGPNSNGTCDADYLKIYNSEDAETIEKGYGSKIIFNGQFGNMDWMNFATEHIYCGSHVPDDYFSGSKEVYIKFKSDDTSSGSGFSLTATAVNGCFRNFTGTQGRILIGDTTDHCDVYIKAPQNYSLSLYYADITFSEYDCAAEYIEVFDAHTNKSLQRVCSYTEAGKSLFSNTNELRMRIKMNGYYTQYDMTYLASRTGVGCGGDLYNTAGVITNPFYPNNVRNNSDCRWNIRVPSNLRVFLRFEIFDLGAKVTCHSDYLQLIEYDENDRETVVRQFCGEDHPKAYKSERSRVTVRFHKTVNFDGTGWVMRFNGVYTNYKVPDYYANE